MDNVKSQTEIHTQKKLPNIKTLT